MLWVLKDMTGGVFGRLTALSHVGADSTGKAKWLCECTCGKRVIIVGWNMRQGLTKSCGCLRAEISAARTRARATHGFSRRSEYATWRGMILRCANPRAKGYINYGGRGISVCERWRTFEGFLGDMGEKPTPSHTLDRINNDGNYEPGNCRWATAIEQARNTRRSHLIEVGGLWVPIVVASEILGQPEKAFTTRLARGWPLNRALLQPYKRIPSQPVTTVHSII